MHDVCTEQHVGNTKCARPLSLLPTPPTVLSFFRFRGTPTPLLVHPFPPTISLSPSLSVFRALPPLLPRSGGQNINDRANHPEHEHRATPRGEEGGEACNCRELAKCRIGGGTMGECVHGTGRIPGRRGVAVQAAGMVLRCLSITLRQLPPFVIVARSRFR